MKTNLDQEVRRATIKLIEIAIERGEVLDNGKTGKERRIEPKSLDKFIQRIEDEREFIEVLLGTSRDSARH